MYRPIAGGEELIAAHIDLAEWADLILVYPATLDYSSRLAHGIADSPSLLAAMTTEAQVCIAPALPPRALANPIVAETLRKLRMPENFLVIDPVPGPSESSDVALAGAAVVPCRDAPAGRGTAPACGGDDQRRGYGMSAAMDSRQKAVIRSTRTDLLSTGVYEVGGGAYEWVHSLGVGAPIPFSSLPVSIDSVPRY